MAAEAQSAQTGRDLASIAEARDNVARETARWAPLARQRPRSAHRRVHARSRHRLLGAGSAGAPVRACRRRIEPSTRSTYGIVPRRPVRAHDFVDIKSAQRVAKVWPVDSVATTRRLAPGKGYADLLPRAGPVGRSITLACTTRRGYATGCPGGDLPV
jgi:hypothetical protein